MGLLDWSVWAILCTASLCWAMQMPLMCRCVQVVSVVAACQFHGLGKVCSWGWDMLVARRCPVVVSYVLGVLEFFHSRLLSWR